MNRRTLACLLLLLYATLSHAGELKPFADIHLHYKWDQEEVISPAEVTAILEKNQVILGVVSGEPSSHALKLVKQAPDRVIALFSPYISPTHKHNWFLDPKVLQEAENALASGQYQGIGELHLWASFPPRKDNKVLLGLLKLAAQYDKPFLIHTEAPYADYLIPICQQHDRVRFLWAHAGGKIHPQGIEKAMKACPNLWVEVSARDPWRYNSLVNEEHLLPEDWKALFIKYSDRFMTGTDPVWSVTKGQRWDEADEGWQHYDQLLEFHRAWLNELPEEVELKIRLTNALKFFDREQ